MANFVCDICGGAIKMQANRTGVCQGCGMEYDIEAIKAMAGQINNSVPVQSTNENELDRESLLIYLGEVRIVETLIYESKQTKQKLIDKAETISKIDSKEKFSIPEKPIEPIKPVDNLPYILLSIFIFLLFAICTGTFLIMEYNNASEGGVIFMLLALSMFFAFCVSLDKTRANKKYKSEYQLLKTAFDNAMVDYENKIKKYEYNVTQESATKLKKINDIKNDINSILSDIKMYEQLLSQAYNANIIPMQFRTIEGVYYLYDYLSTSNQTLSEALMQANLEAIKQKLDQMIQLQSAQIIQQAQTNARLAEIQDTNNRILATAQQNARTSALAAKYAAITAVNSEVIKHLSTKQLAYQRADFWLK